VAVARPGQNTIIITRIIITAIPACIVGMAIVVGIITVTDDE